MTELEAENNRLQMIVDLTIDGLFLHVVGSNGLIDRKILQSAEYEGREVILRDTGNLYYTIVGTSESLPDLADELRKKENSH